MAKFSGMIGFGKQTKTKSGVFEDVITEKKYYGDLLENNRKLQTNAQVNDNINVSNQISIIGDLYANQNFYSMRYVIFMGAKWKILNVDVKYPRLILSIGGLYNGK